MVSSGWLTTLASLSRGLLQRSGKVIAVKDQMDLILVTALAVQCGCEVVCPLVRLHAFTQSGLPIAWATTIPSMTVTFLGGNGAFSLVTSTSFFRQLLECCKEELLRSTGILCNAHKSSSDFHDAVDDPPNGTEWDLVLVDGKVSIHELLVYDLKGCHLCKVEWNQPGILVLPPTLESVK